MQAKNDQNTNANNIYAKFTGKRVCLTLTFIYLIAFLFEYILGGEKVLVFGSPEVMVNLGGSWGVGTIAGHQYWRLLSSLFIHASLVHLLLNIYVLIDFCGLAERALGSLRFTFIYFLSGIIGCLASMIYDPTQLVAGASAANIGAIGAYLAVSWLKRIPDHLGFSKPQIVVLCVFFLYSFLLGLTSNYIDNTAHVAGLFAGIVAGIVLTSRSKANFHLVKWRIAQVLALSAIPPVLVAVAIARMDKDPRVEAAIARQAGVELLEEKKYLHGLEYLNKAVALNPKSAGYLRDRARALIELDKPQAALRDITAALAIDPRDAAIWGTRAHLFHTLGKQKEAIADLDKALEIKPNSGMTYNNRAWMKLAAGDVDGAQADIKKSIELEPGNLTAYDTRGMIYFMQGRMDQAEADFNLLKKKKPKEGASYYHLALIHQKAGKIELAKEEGAKARALQYEPDPWEPVAPGWEENKLGEK